MATKTEWSTDKWQEYRLDRSVLAYVREYLAHGNSLAKAVLNYTAWSSGEFFTAVDRRLPIDRLYRLDSIVYHDFRPPAELYVDWLLPLLWHHKEAEDVNYLIGEDQDLRPEYDNSISQSPYTPIFYQQEAYYVLGLDQLTKEGLRALVEWNRSRYMFFIWTRLPVQLKAAELDEVFFVTAAINASAFVCQIYDDEGFLFWRRTTNKRR